MIWQTPGLRLSMIGSIVFLFGLIALVFLPLAIALAGLMIGGFGVWGGFIWTLFSYYGPGSNPADDARQ